MSKGRSETQEKKRTQTGTKAPEGKAFGDHLGATARQGAWAGILNLLGAGVRYLNTLLLARILGPWVYGLFAYANTVVTIVTVPASLGFPTALVHFVAGSQEAGHWERLRWFVRTCFRLAAVLSTLAALGLFLASGLVSERILGNAGYILPLAGLSLALPALVLFNLASGGLQGLRAIREKVFVERVAHPLLFLALLAGAASFHPSLEVVVACFWVACAAVLVAGLIFFARRYRRLPRGERTPSAPRWKELFHFSVPVLFLQLLNYLILWSDVLVMGLFASPAEVGVYTVASRLATAVNMPTEALSASLAPSFSALAETKDHGTLAGLYRTSTRWIFLASSAIALALILGGHSILALVRREYAAGFAALAILSCGQALSGAFGANGTLITMTGHPKVNLVNAVFFGLGNLGLMFLLVPRYGALGAASAAALSLTLVNVVRALEIWGMLRIAPWDRTLLKPLAALVGASLAGAAAALLLHPWAGLALGLPLYFLLWLLFGPEPEERELLAKLRRGNVGRR